MTLTTLAPRTSRTTPAPLTLGLDLTGLGRQHDAPVGTTEPAADRAVLHRLDRYATAATEHGIGFVSLGHGFRLGRASTGALDAVRAAARLTVPTLAELPAAAAHRGTRALRPGTAVCLPGPVTAELATSWRAVGGRVVLAVDTVEQAEAAGGVADTVRLRTDDPHWARELRYAARAAARGAGREVDVLVDLHAVLSVRREVAAERAALITAVADGVAPWAGAAVVVGSPEDLLDEISAWVGAGAVDGFVLHPGSVRADVRALLCDVLPVLRAELAEPADLAQSA